MAKQSADAQGKRCPLVVIIGMHRSGTSALAGALIGSGLAAPKRLMPARADNPKGFWEPLHIVRLNNRLLADAGLTWDDPRPVAKEWLDSPERSKDHEEAVKLLSLEFDQSTTGVGVLKDPRISKLVPFWNKVFALGGYDAKYIICLRNPLEVAESLTLRNAFDTNTCMALWLSYLQGAIRGTSRHCRALVSFDEVLENPATSVERVLRSLELPTKEFASRSGSASIDIGLRHHVCAWTAPFDEPSSVRSALKLYERLMKLREN